jgi:exodeoxyribonuclease VII small subunit
LANHQLIEPRRRQNLLYCELYSPARIPYYFTVANASKGAGLNQPAKNPPFEEALKSLERVVEVMEADDLPLETLLAKYEEGIKLVKVCQETLAEADLKIQELEKNAAGDFKLKPLEVSET